MFGSLCGVDAIIITELLMSVLPLEIARDMRADMQGMMTENILSQGKCVGRENGLSIWMHEEPHWCPFHPVIIL